MNKIFQLGLIILLTFSSSRSFAGFIFNVDSYTASSITFTVDGDMSGYTAGSEKDAFGLVYNGDIWANNLNYSSNMFSDSVFDNASPNGGNTGSFGGTRPYTWSTGSISNATANMNTTTISWNLDLLNINPINWSVDLVQGNGFSGNVVEVLASDNTVGPIAVPEPTTLAIFALSIVGLASRRFKK
jgi:hypothetical protein